MSHSGSKTGKGKETQGNALIDLGFLAILSLVSSCCFTQLALVHAQGSDNKEGRAFLAGTFQRNKAVVVNAQGKVEWEFDAPACFDVWALPNKNYLVASRGKGIMEVTPDKKIVFHFKTDGETYTCQPLAGGRILVGDNQNGRLIEINAEGKIEREVKVESKAKPHGMIRTARKLANNHYLVCQREDNLVREYDPAGKVVWEFKTPGPMAALRLPEGNTLVSNAAADILEIDHQGKTVWQFGKKERADNNLKTSGVAYGLQRLPNGNTVIAISGTIFETTRERKVLWSRNDDAVKNTVCFQVLDVPGDPSKGEILR